TLFCLSDVECDVLSRILCNAAKHGCCVSVARMITFPSQLQGSFVPTVTAISSTPDLQWMVQPTIITSESPSLCRAESSEPAKSKAAGNKGKCAARKSKSEQLSPEEEEKKRIRRERNKMAAAKCRNRRRELTDTLQAVSTDIIHNIRISFRNLQFIQNILFKKKVIHTMLFCAIVQGFFRSQCLCFSPTIRVKIPGRITYYFLTNTIAIRIHIFKGLLHPKMQILSLITYPDSVANDLEPLSTPVVSTFTPTCSNYLSVFTFACPELDSLAEGLEGCKGGVTKAETSVDILNSPTLLAL
uniref:V-fos FBJ murine osteosarcoma viral oncogene homolog Aa n=1 Tax=Sinocyclocheilus rhinocerous TaxID=307959 RepID=A0A673K8M7_9TELE